MEIVKLKINTSYFSDEDLFAFCQDNKDLKIERDKNKNILLMAPTGDFTSSKNVELCYELVRWNRTYKLGMAFDSNAGFYLPNGAMRSPDGAWISHERLKTVSEEQLEKFAPVCPNFIFELKSPSDNLKELEEKMKEWIENGVELAWLIDPKKRLISIYKPHAEVSQVSFDLVVGGEEVLKGFELRLSDII